MDVAMVAFSRKSTSCSRFS